MWTDRISIEKQGSRWVVEFDWLRGEMWERESDFISYAKTKQEAQELAEEWLIEQAERILYDLGAWTDIRRGPCPHCKQMVQWDRLVVVGGDWYRVEESAVTPHSMPTCWIAGWRMESQPETPSATIWECQECGGTVQ